MTGDSLFEARRLIERANYDQHQFTVVASDYITELADELEKALRVVEAALAIDSHAQGFPPLVPPSLIQPFRNALAPYQERRIVLLDLDALPDGELERIKREIPRG